MAWASGDTVTSAKLNHRSNAGPVFNVLDPAYGATGDGSADDTSAFTAAIAAADAAGGGVVFVPATSTNYSITTTLFLPDKVSLVGATVGTSDIKAASTFTFGSATNGEAMVVLGSSANTTKLAFGTYLENIRLDCDSIDNSVGVFSNVAQEHCGLRNVYVNNADKYGAHFRSNTTLSTAAQNYFVEHSTFILAETPDTNAIGLFIEGIGARSVTGITVDRPAASAQTAGLAGIALDNLNGMIVTDVHGEQVPAVVLFGPTTGVNACGVIGATGANNVDTVVRFNGNSGNCFAAAITKNGATWSIEDSISSTTITTGNVGFYAVNNDGRTVMGTDPTRGQSFSYNSIPDTYTNAAADFVMRWFDGEGEINALGIALANTPRRKAVLATNNNYEFALAFGGTILMSTDTVSSAISLGANALSMQSATNLPADVSGRGYLYADSISSLYWVDGTSGTSHLIV